MARKLVKAFADQSKKTLRTTSKVFVLKPLPSTHMLGSYIFTYFAKTSFGDPTLWT